MNKKKILAGMIAVALLVMGFTGCAKNTDNSEVPTDIHNHTSTTSPTKKPNTGDVETDFAITVGTVSGKPGDTVYIPIEVTNNPGVCAFYITMNYSEKLDLISHKDGDVLSSPLHGGNLDANPYNLTWDDALEENTNNGVITTLEFVISKDAKAGEKLEISVKPMFGGEGAILDFDLNDIPINCVAGGVTVE